jgi:hypothetical protein
VPYSALRARSLKVATLPLKACPCTAVLFREHILLENRCCLCQTFPLQHLQIFGGCLRRVPQALAMPLRGGQHGAGRQVKKMNDEFIRMLCFDLEVRENFRRKVLHVRRDDHVGAPP